MKILDTNMILRFILGDNAEMKNKATEIINENIVIIPNEVAAEVIYVLTKVYKVEREKAANAVLTMLKIDNIRASDPDVLKTALKYYKEKSLDFVDCLLLGYYLECGYEICTFDKKLIKIIDKI